MKRRSFFAHLAGLIAIATMAPEIIGSPGSRPPIHYDHLIDLEAWIRRELCERLSIAIDRHIMFGEPL